MGSFISKEDDVNRISTSIFVSNIPDSFSAKDLFSSCKQFGHVVDSYIPLKRTKEGKRFGFVRFINVFNVDRLVNNLCLIWVGPLKLHANITRFQRAPLNKKKSLMMSNGEVRRGTDNSSRLNGGNMGSGKSYVNVIKATNMAGHMDTPGIVLDEECFVDLTVRYSGELWVLLEFSSSKIKEAFCDNVGVGSWFSELRKASLDIHPDGRIIPELLEELEYDEQSVDGSIKDVNKVTNEGNDGVNSDIDEITETVFDNLSGLKGDKSDDPFGLYSLLNKNAKGDKVESMSTRRFKKSEAPRSGGSFLNLMEEVVKVSQTIGYNMGEWFGSNFNAQGAGVFNSFIANAGLEEVPLEGSAFTWFHKSTSKIRDENSSFFHGMLNKKRNQTNIRGIMVDDVWKDHPSDIKKEILLHFQNRFVKPVERRAIIEMCYPRSLLNEQREEIKRKVTKEELKTAVWDCGTDKSPGPDGYTFGFYRKFWSIIENDVYAAVKHFFNHRDIPVGCNASFTDLIPKIPDTNLRVIDARLFKGINLNHSPTDEFQFFKGLKQGDPLSPFLFILIMESLHLSFQRVIDAGLFKGINLNHSLCLSHMFYADDAVFVGQWSDGNINTLIHVLDCFFHASGLRINMSKSNIMEVDVVNAYVNQAASKLGCLVLNSPFSFLGTKVGEAMSRIQAWKEVVEKVKSRLSMWKMKTLSIGGRLTLLKFVLGSIPIFHMSIFRVSSRVLHVLESIRGNFFNGHEMGSNKATWVKWNYVLTDKKHAGLGVSSLYALNRGLMIKWVWRFFTQKESLWAKVITAIYGDDDKVESRCHAVRRSCWLSIVNEVRILKNKGMNIFDFMNLKLGNGDTSRFWTDRWYAGGIIKDLCPRLFALENCKEIFVQLDSLAEVVRSINLVSLADRWIWNLESSGEFSVASAGKKIDEIRFPIVKDATRWVKCVPIKVNILAWKIRNDALPTRINISRRGIDIQSISCPICENGVESSEHLLLNAT
nr:RNA-directed DNA polymerase, eukaryota, reverse transcriptase zinc-binding domain protein [Tanacetum cinerariifolium]